MAIELVSNLFWVLLGLTISWLAIDMGLGSFGAPGAGMVSAGLGVLIALIGVGGIIKLLVKGHPAEPAEPWTGGMMLRIAAVVAALIVYVALLERIGFLVLTTILLAGLFGFLGGIRWKWAVPLAAILAGSNYALFKLLLGTQLPTGILG